MYHSYLQNNLQTFVIFTKFDINQIGLSKIKRIK